MRRKNRNRKSRHLIRHPQAGAPSDPQVSDVELEVEVEEQVSRVELVPSVPATTMNSFISDVGGTGHHLRNRAAERRNRDTLFAFLIFLSLTCLIVMGAR